MIWNDNPKLGIGGLVMKKKIREIAELLKKECEDLDNREEKLMTIYHNIVPPCQEKTCMYYDDGAWGNCYFYDFWHSCNDYSRVEKKKKKI
ncbi:MAG: hypothetical protein D6707_09435 [Bacteroidetes bacterium]|nr:MAG: hypothetical protein D6707_09435 [Bacteroidota bacterium]